MGVIEDRRAHPPERSYTTPCCPAAWKIGRKIMEEAAEVVEAARHVQGREQRDHLIPEAADLLYHLFVMLGYRQIPLPEVAAELARRFGISGLDEKAARPTPQDS